MSYEVTLLVFGILLLLLGLVGKIKAKEIEVGTSSVIVRVVTLIIGLILIVLSFNPEIPKNFLSSLAEKRIVSEETEQARLEQERRKIPLSPPTIGMEMVSVPKGCFQMGSNSGENDEKPIHKVCITKDYYLGKYEVTQGQWQKIMGNNRSYFKKGNNYSVEKASWNDIQTFIRKLNNKTGKHYRLPTEAEWEYACRSGGKDQKYCGGNHVDGLAWYNSNSGHTTHPVGQKSPNGLGLYDMSGNVWEWVQDYYGENYYQSSPINDPKGVSSSLYRSLRGGSWNSGQGGLRSAIRIRKTSNVRNYNFGFRLAQDL